MSDPLITPDGRYLVVRGRLWRCSDPRLDAATRAQLVNSLMSARREKGQAKRRGDADGVAAAKHRVDEAKRGLGERGPVWWADGSPDLTRRMAVHTDYAAWFLAQTAGAAAATD